MDCDQLLPYMYIQYMLMYLSIHDIFGIFPPATCTLEQTVPGNNEPVCSEGELSYTCTTNSGVVQWEILDPYAIVVFMASDVNKTEGTPIFTFKLIEVNGSMLISTATAQMVNSSIAGIDVRCYDGKVSLFTKVTVAGTCT